MSLPPPKKIRSTFPKTLEVAPVDEEVVGEEPKKKVDVASLRGRIDKLLGVSTYEPEQRYWLDTGYPALNAVYGSREKGIPYGKLYETSGVKHGGKTAITTILGGMAQADGAAVIYIDLEDSRDPVWAGKLSLDFDNVMPVYPKLVRYGSDKKSKKKGGDQLELQLQSAELLFKEAEILMAMNREAGYKKQFVMLDSLANIYTEMQIAAGTTDRNMRVNVDRAQFLSSTLPRWAALAANYNAMVHFINQLRVKPGVMFGDPHYTPGGSAIPFAVSIQTRVKRLGNGHILQNSNVIGVKGIIENRKNKAGGGSVEGAKCQFKIRWHKAQAKLDFTDVEGEE